MFQVASLYLDYELVRVVKLRKQQVGLFQFAMLLLALEFDSILVLIRYQYSLEFLNFYFMISSIYMLNPL